MINKYVYYYILFRSATTKIIIGTFLWLVLKIIHRHTRTRAEMIVKKGSFRSDDNLFFLSVMRLAL